MERQHICDTRTTEGWHYWSHPDAIAPGIFCPIFDDLKASVPGVLYIPCPDHDGLPNHERI